MMIHSVKPDGDGGFTFKMRKRREETVNMDEVFKAAFRMFYERSDVEVEIND